jgi:hypothetical protein
MKLAKNTIIPIIMILLLAYLGHYIYVVDGQIDWLRFCLVFGIPFGVPYMLWVIPIGGSPAASVAILALNVAIGALFGCVIAAFALIRALIYFVWWLAGKTIGRQA